MSARKWNCFEVEFQAWPLIGEELLIDQLIRTNIPEHGRTWFPEEHMWVIRREFAADLAAIIPGKVGGGEQVAMEL